MAFLAERIIMNNDITLLPSKISYKVMFCNYQKRFYYVIGICILLTYRQFSVPLKSNTA